MSIIETITDSIGTLLEAAKDMPTEKIAAVGLIVLGAAAIAKDSAQDGLSTVAEKIVDLTDHGN